MMMRRAVLGAAGAAALLLASAAPATADSVVRWLTAQPCATAQLTVSSTPDTDTTVSGWIDPCQRPARAERFGFVYYVQDPEGGGPRGYVYLERLRHYGTAEATAFEGTVDRDVASRFGSVLALCLATGPGRLVTCVPGMYPDADAPPPPRPTLQELAALPVIEIPPSPADPNCATCV
ncbi:hypothetical protein ACTMTJ_03655 [Phytohabitans sp. LJ34]|uniref:hypothetical protein n=1 Tax=Phytohabitans sp. LJ34 TaxID=3452217 RepID=UPI003F8BA2B9